jgi:DNA-binding NarL/FixJ family response regulator
MTAARRRDEEYNMNWENDIKSFDDECRARDDEFHKTHMVIKDPASSDLTEDEQAVFELVLKGATCSEIAEKYEVEVEVITGLLEIIRAKLSLTDSNSPPDPLSYK